MGNQQSISTVINDTINKSMTDVLMSSSQNCSQTNSLVQTMNFNNITSEPGCSLKFSNISQDAKQSPNFKCALQSENSSKLLTDFKTTLEQEASSKTSGIGGSLNSQSISDVKNRLINDITSKININTVANCVQDTLAEQTVNFTNIKGSCPSWCNNPALCAAGLPSDLALKLCDTNLCTVSYDKISQNLVQSVVGECLSENKNVSDAVNTASNEIKQTSTSSSTGFDPASFMTSLLPSIIISCIILVILSSIGYFMMSAQGGDGEMPNMPNMPNMQNFMPKNMPKNMPEY